MVAKAAAAIMAAAAVAEGVGSIAAGKEAEGLAQEEAAQIEQAAEFNRGLARERSKRLLSRNIAESGSSVGGSDYQVMLDNLIQTEFEADINQYNSRRKADTVRRQGSLQKREAFRSAFGSFLGAGASLSLAKWDTKLPNAEWRGLESSPIRGFDVGQ